MKNSRLRHFFGTRKRVYFVAMLVVVLLVGGAVARPHRASYVAVTLDPAPTPIGYSGRTSFRFSRGECIVLRPPIELVGEDDWQLYNGVDEEKGLVRHILPVGDRWHVESNRPEQLTTFNCATFAIGEVIGLTRADYLNPQAASFLNGQNPAHILLQEFYSRYATYPLAGINWQQLDEIATLQENDVVVFATGGSDREYVHLGKITKWKGRNRMVSKMGRGPIVRGTIKTTAKIYEGRFNEIQIYRRS